jgi:hypothetical protein
MHEESTKTWLPSKGVTLLLKATLPTCVLSRRGLSLHQHAPRSSPYDTGLGPTRHASWPRAEEAKPPRAERTTAQRLQALLHFRPDQRVKRRAAMQAACNRTKGAHPFDSDAPSMGAQAHTSCNRRAGYYVQETAPPLAPVQRLLDCGTEAATRGNPAHGPTVSTEHISHGSASRGRRRDGRYGQKWTSSNGGGRRAEATIKSSAGSRPLLGQRESPLPRRKDDAPVSIPRTARARTTTAPRTTLPVALTLRQDRRYLWQAKQATLHLRHDDRVKKGTPRRSNSYPFFSSPFSLLLQGPGKGILRKGSFSAKEAGPEPSY